MRHHVFVQSPTDTYKVALLCKASAFNKQEIQRNYLDKLVAHGMSEDNVIAFTLDYNEVGKAPVKHIKEYLASLLPALNSLQSAYLYCADSAFFKVLVGQTKADVHSGYILPCSIKGYEHLKVVLGMNYQQLIYDPSLQHKLDAGLTALALDLKGSYQAPGSGIIHQAVYPQGLQEVADALQALHSYPELSADIEAFSLRFNTAGIGTIAFATDKHSFVAFPCDYEKVDTRFHAVLEKSEKAVHGRFVPNPAVRALLKAFFIEYKGKITWHNASYDLKIIIYTLWMKDLRDTQGLLEGLEVMTRLIDDTKLIAYLATNSTAGNTLGLKYLAHEFAGNWAKDDIKDICRIKLSDLLQYNGIDCLSTFYVKEKYWPVMVKDNQLELYLTWFLSSLKTLLQTELTGMPMGEKQIQIVKGKLQVILAEHVAIIEAHPLVLQMDLVAQTNKMNSDNAKLKVKQHPLSKYADVRFNPGSDLQMRHLLYEVMQLPVIDLTDSKLPATGGKTIKKLLNHTQDASWIALLEALQGYASADKILTSFIPAFERAIKKNDDGIVWLHGNFNIGGTVSGRLSSSEPNLTNIPAKSIFAKLIKECFMAPEGWLMCGADFYSLEDMISALTTKDKNKLKVYTDGFDGHCLRAAYYYRDQLMHIDLDDPKSVNTIKKTHEDLRQESKVPTFALTYQGTYHTLVANLGWPVDKAKRIEASYHEMYAESDEYIQTKLEQASKTGYVEVAFGLRVRTPLLKQVVFHGSKMPYEAAAEGRTAGNALGQSYCMLNCRAANDFMQRVHASEFKYDILPIAQIHDCIYLLIRDDVRVVEWANHNLIEAMQWQELPEIQHPIVKLGANLDIFWPHWGNAVTLPNNATQDEIINLCKKGIKEYGEKV